MREPWQFGPELESICRRYLKLRYRLLPYIYNAVHYAFGSGIPVVRALIADFPQDFGGFEFSDEYLFGPEILVAPILDEGATQRGVYLPPCEWIDFWSEAICTGPKWIEVPASLDTLRKAELFGRASPKLLGSILINLR